MPSHSTFKGIKQNHYQVLDLHRTATTQEIRKRYKELALKYHPDKAEGVSRAKEKFQKIQAAYEVLTDEELRADLDQEMDWDEQLNGEERTHDSEADPCAEGSGAAQSESANFHPNDFPPSPQNPFAGKQTRMEWFEPSRHQLLRNVFDTLHKLDDLNTEWWKLAYDIREAASEHDTALSEDFVHAGARLDDIIKKLLGHLLKCKNECIEMDEDASIYEVDEQFTWYNDNKEMVQLAHDYGNLLSRKLADIFNDLNALDRMGYDAFSCHCDMEDSDIEPSNPNQCLLIARIHVVVQALSAWEVETLKQRKKGLTQERQKQALQADE